MAYAVSLFFDPETDVAVRAIWSAVDHAGISSFLARGPFHPHITLAIFDRVDVPQARGVLAAIAMRHSALPIALPSIGLFAGSEGVVYLAATMTSALLSVHRDVHLRMASSAGTSVPYYLPDRWNPHCSVARDLREEQIPEAVALCAKYLPETMLGLATQIGLIETPLEVEIFRFDLAGRVGG